MSTPPPPDIQLPPSSPASRPRTVDAGELTPIDAEEGSAGRVSMYVKLFNEMVTTVLEHEAYLFTPREVWVLKHILELPYEPHYLLTRLLLRRPGKVHGLASIVPAYSGELGEEGVVRAVKALCMELAIPEEVEAGDPTPGPDLWAQRRMERSQSSMGSSSATTTDRPWANIPTGLSAKEERADPELAEAIRQSLWAERGGMDIDTPEDSGLSTPGNERSNTQMGSADCAFSLQPLEMELITALAHNEMELTLSDIMTSVSADDLRRVARARKVPAPQMATRESTMKALKDVAHRQKTLSFAPVDSKGKGKATNGVKRNLSNTGTSEHLVIAELLPCLGGHVIQIDKSLYALVARVNLVFSRTPPVSASAPALLLPPILVTANRRHYPDYGKPTRSVIWKDRDEILTWERAVTWEVMVSETLGDNWVERRKGAPPGAFGRAPILSRAKGAKIVREVWASVWPYWKDMVSGDGGKAPDAKNIGDRFQTGYVLTRIVYKGAEALGILHEYELQCEVLRALLAQRRWRRGKRGAWYDRLALILMNHFKGTPEERIAKLEEATQVCIDGLLDEDTHIIYRPGLSRRLTRLENKLNLPPEERHISYAQLLTCETRELVATRVQQNAGLNRRPSGDNTRKVSVPGEFDDREPQTRADPSQVGKSVWLGRDGEVTVEGWVLEWWENKGYQGFHAESSILTTLFALLMWPVLFHPIPGAFETLYQTGPLDLGEDTFARARRDLIDERLRAMESTESALEMLKETDSRERPRGTWAVGLSWDFGANDLQEIMACIGGRAMSSLCRMLSEEYRHRSSGVPDLIVWNYAEREARFVEVKGPGDNLSETQKVWIDVLLSSGVPVEVCRVKARDGSPERRPKPTKRTSSGRKPLMKKREPETELITIDTTDEEKDDEWAHESGEEGKREGHWEKRARR